MITSKYTACYLMHFSLEDFACHLCPNVEYLGEDYVLFNVICVPCK